MADRYRDNGDSNYFQESYGAQSGDRDGGRGRTGYGDDRDTRQGYRGYEGRDFQDRYSQRGDDRTVQGKGADGRNWAERATDEVQSWVGDSDAEQRRERDRQQLGRYPGEDRGERNYGGTGTSGYTGRGAPSSDRPYEGRDYGTDRAYGARPIAGQTGYQRTGHFSRDYDGDRTVQGSGAEGRNWAERATDEVQSWVGDRDAEGRRERDRQTIGRYPGEDRGERNYGLQGASRYESGRDYGQSNQGSSGSSNYGATSFRDNSPEGNSRGLGYTGATSADSSGAGYRPGSERSSGSSNTYGQASGQGYRPSTSGMGNNPDDSTRYNNSGSWKMGQDAGHDDRGFLSKAADEVKSWFGDDEAERRRNSDVARDDATTAFSNTGGTQALGTRTTSGYDPHYLEYRNQRAAEYDRDYHEYRQTKAKDFHQDFHSFRSQKQDGGTMGAVAGMAAGAVSALGTSAASASAGGTGLGASTTMGSQVREHMVVVGSDGQGVGKVDHVDGADIKLTRKDSTDGKHHLIPLSWVAGVEGDKVKLSKTSDAAMREWREAPPKQA